jgi:ABC-type bacteriocin/lantibiotic exporter with double-glycine peptidase domain
VMNAYGRHLIASDVLQVEQNLGVWDVQLGLLRDDGIAMTADYFGFATSSSHSLTVDQVVAIANQGKPVIVSVRDSVNFPGGHIFVVSGGDAQSVFVVDSSLLNLHTLTRAQFSGMWQGFSAVLTPRN